MGTVGVDPDSCVVSMMTSVSAGSSSNVNILLANPTGVFWRWPMNEAQEGYQTAIKQLTLVSFSGTLEKE
jgi:hypothetical protein